MLKRIVVLLLTTTILFTTSITAIAASNDGWTEASRTEAAKNGAWDKWVKTWDTIKNNPTEMSLTPGKNATELNFAWYSKDSEGNPKLKIGKKQDMSEAKEIAVTTKDIATNAYKSNKATATGLAENTTYYYSYQINGAWSAATPYKTQSTKSFSFLYIGDPQIGSSSGNNATGTSSSQGQDAAVRNDSFNWNNTINTALKVHPNVSFMLSVGDQIQTTSAKNNEQDIEYAGYLSPNALKSLPVATAIGNHDSKNSNYTYHFNNPNASTLGATEAGGDYYYSYGNTLFITLNTNNKNIAEHKELIEKAISENKDAKWRVVTIHHDIYGSGEHSNEPDVVNLRYNLIPIFEENHIDAVLTGHDHTYSRSLILKGGAKDESKMITGDDFDEEFSSSLEGKETTQKYKDYLTSIEDSKAVQDVTLQNGSVVDPKGILYMTANSASGSKYYDLVQHKQSYIANRWQEDVPTYSTIDVDEVSFTINTYRTDNGEKIDNTFSITKSLDKSSLNELIAAGEEKINSKDTYTTSTFSKLEKTLAVAKTISDKAASNSQEISDAYTNLKEGINGIESKGDKAELKALVDSTKSTLDNAVVGTDRGQYPSEAKDKLKIAITAAESTLGSEDANQSTVDRSVENLNEELQNFKTKVIKENAVKAGTSDTTETTVNPISTVSPSTTSNSSTEKLATGVSNVKTGDNFSMYTIVIAGASAAAFIYINRKKINIKKRCKESK
ncbi:purple acid phosphatase family protein [Clostridium arbusti]|uniref:purple acid phosphatase family protein n=1 Tax=Clostridium arbusti TaxID=1137848 RepID=UPI0002880D79|nr:metallophosphoesterase family protein [Clostridium arbusti]